MQRKFKNVRKTYIKELEQIEGLRVIPSQANYVMCEIISGISSKKLTENLLEENILIKVVLLMIFLINIGIMNILLMVIMIE